MPFKKGQSGNPGGRPKRDPKYDALLKKYGPKSISIIAELMLNAIEQETRLSAAKYLADRAYGKPAQAVELSGKDGKELLAPVINVTLRSPKA